MLFPCRMSSFILNNDYELSRRKERKKTAIAVIATNSTIIAQKKWRVAGAGILYVWSVRKRPGEKNENKQSARETHVSRPKIHHPVLFRWKWAKPVTKSVIYLDVKSGPVVNKFGYCVFARFLAETAPSVTRNWDKYIGTTRADFFPETIAELFPRKRGTITFFFLFKHCTYNI